MDEVAKDVDRVTITNVDSDDNVKIYEKIEGDMKNSLLKEENAKNCGGKSN